MFLTGQSGKTSRLDRTFGRLITVRVAIVVLGWTNVSRMKVDTITASLDLGVKVLLSASQGAEG